MAINSELTAVARRSVNERAIRPRSNPVASDEVKKRGWFADNFNVWHVLQEDATQEAGGTFAGGEFINTRIAGRVLAQNTHAQTHKRVYHSHSVTGI